jgi:hypothetical protein
MQEIVDHPLASARVGRDLLIAHAPFSAEETPPPRKVFILDVGELVHKQESFGTYSNGVGPIRLEFGSRKVLDSSYLLSLRRTCS